MSGLRRQLLRAQDEHAKLWTHDASPLRDPHPFDIGPALASRRDTHMGESRWARDRKQRDFAFAFWKTKDPDGNMAATLTALFPSGS